MTKTLRSLFAIASLAVVVGCVDEGVLYESPDRDLGENIGRFDVVLPLDREVNSRTYLDPNDMSVVRWSVGDQLALWADGTVNPLVGEKFTMRYYGTSFTQAEFSASLTAEMDGSATYNYRGFYPYPSSIDSKKITYEIGAVQSGEYDGTYDFRVADPVEGVGLSSSTLGGSSLSFRSLTHVLKIVIPEGMNLLEEPIAQLQVKFPQGINIVGAMSFDMSNTEESPTMESGSSIATIDLSADPIDANSGEAWLFINPIAGAISGSIEISGVGVSGAQSSTHTISFSDRTFRAGYITPVNTAIEAAASMTDITFSLGTDNLGEAIEKLTFETEDGSILVLGESRGSKVECESNVDNKYILSVPSDQIASYTGNIAITLESKSAIVSTQITLGALIADGENLRSADVPYLYFEDFGSALTKDDGGDRYTVGDGKTTSDTLTTMSDLESWGLEGWYGCRVGSYATNSLRVCGREDKGTHKVGRVDSSTLSALKPGATVKIKLSYNYVGKEYEWADSGILVVDGVTGDPQYRVGYHSTGAPSTSATLTGVSFFAEWKDTETYTTISTNDYQTAAFTTTHTFTMSEAKATNATRIVWLAGCDKGTNTNYFGTMGDQNGNYWLYIDNVKISIVE